MKLRDYQETAVRNVFAAWRDKPSTLVVLPTGCGKTVVFASVIKQLVSETHQRVLVLAHREELIFQAVEKIQHVTGLDVQIEMAELRAGEFFGEKAPVIVSTIQTQATGRMERFDPSDFAAVIVDEAHHATSPSYRKVIDRYLNGNPSCRLLGVTATPDRLDEAALGQVFASVASNYEMRQAIEDGWLVPVRQQLVSVSSLDYSGIGTKAGDLNAAQLAEVMEEEENLQRVAAPIREMLGKTQKRAIIFAASVRQAERLAEILNRDYPEPVASWVCGETPKDRRREILTRFKTGELRYVVNVGVLTEGFDDAGVEVIVMARPTKSRALYAQMVGRATRPAAELAGQLSEIAGSDAGKIRRDLIATSSKPSCLVIDFVGNAGRHKLITSADLLGGKYSDEVIREAKARMTDRDDKNGCDVGEALEKANAAVEARKKREAEQRAIVRATAIFSTTKIDPFNMFDLVHVACDYRPSSPLTEREEEHLSKAFGKRAFRKMSEGQKGALADEMRRRRRTGEESFRQQKFLASRKIYAPLRSDEASRAIDAIIAKERWAS